MNHFTIALGIVSFGFVAVLVAGDLPERRYKNDGCQYNMAFLQNPNDQIGLLTLGGSRVRVSMHARDFNKILQANHPNSLPVYNFAHSRYSLEKEYVLLRDMVKRRTPRSALIMIEPRKGEFGTSNPDFHSVAKLQDIPLAISTLWPENKIQALYAVRSILWEHIRFFERTDGKLHSQETLQDCDRFDYRLNVPVLESSYLHYEKKKALDSHLLDWSLSGENEEGFLRWMRAFKSLSQEYNFEIFFILMTGMHDKLPRADLEDHFEAATGLPLITLDRDIKEAISPAGRRDNSHLNHIGRKIFLPWLIRRIKEKCQLESGCL